MRTARTKLAVAVAAGLLTAVAGCGPGHSSTAAGSRPTAKTTPAVPAGSPTQPAAPSSAPATASPVATPPVATTTGPPPAASSPPVPGSTYPGVIADCTSAPPHRLSIRPAAIVLACADNGLGVQQLTWTAWGASTATGQGTFWEHVCTPYCAASSKYAHFPVSVTLSRVKTSAQGQWFSRLTVTWQGKRPSGTMPDVFPLEAPGS